MPTTVSHSDLYQFLKLYKMLRDRGHRTESSDDPVSRTIGFYDANQDVIFVIGLRYVKGMEGDPGPDESIWRPHLDALTTTASRARYFSTDPTYPEPVEPPPQLSRWDILFED